MAEVLFYHLTRSALETALPQLLTRSLAQGWRAEVRSPSRDRAEWLDQKLWLGDDAGFLPHGLAGGPHDGAQPVLLTWDDGVGDEAGATDILFTLDTATFTLDEIPRRTRTCLMFNGNDEAALTHARACWKAVVDAGQMAIYWAQSDTGWTQKAKVEGQQQ